MPEEDEEIVAAVVAGKIPYYVLETRLGDCRRAAGIRREALRRITGREMDGLPRRVRLSIHPRAVLRAAGGVRAAAPWVSPVRSCSEGEYAADQEGQPAASPLPPSRSSSASSIHLFSVIR
ncbi:unnamed protein product [Urochloa humidicola]